MANEIQKKDIPVDIVPDETVRALKAAQLAADAISQYRAGTVAYPFASRHQDPAGKNWMRKSGNSTQE